MQPKTQFYLTNIVGIIVLIFAHFGLNITADQQETLLWLLGGVGTLVNIALVWYHSQQSNELTKTVSGNAVTPSNPPANNQSGFASPRLLWALIMVAIGVLLMIVLTPPAHAATKITLNCTPPTTRVDGSVFSTADIGQYLWQMTQPSTPLQSLGNTPDCTQVYNILANSCVKAGTIFGVSVSDKLGVWSDPGTATLVTDACNTLPKPSKPTVTITVQ